MNISVGGVIDIQTAITIIIIKNAGSCGSEIYCAFIRGHRKSGVISIKHS